MGRAEDIEHIAADWLAKRDRGLTAAEARAFEEWLDASTAHRVSYLRLDATWNRAERLHEVQAHDVPVGEGVDRPRKALLQRFAAAAVVVLTVAAGLYGWQYSRNVFSTEVGGLESIPLVDGSRITLNTDSAVRVRLSGSRRRVDLARGEAFFEVAPDPEHPFVVMSGERAVEVVGTRFALRRLGDELQVLVTEGHVRLRQPGEEAIVDLLAGDVASTQATRVDVERRSLEALEAALSWRTGMLVFRDEPLARVVEEFNRYNDLQIAIADPALASIPIGGAFRTNNEEGFLRLLQDGFGIRVQIRDGRRVLLSAADASPSALR